MTALFLTTLLALLSAGDDPPPALELSDPRHVRALYLDLLGRTPDPLELELAASTRPSILVKVLCRDPQFWVQWYEEELYYFLLLDNTRPEDAAPGDGLAERLARGELQVFQAVRALASGSAFHRANPGNDTFVSVVFEQLLGLTVQRNAALLQAGKRMYDGHEASLWGERGSSQSDVVAIACRQPAFAEQLVRRQHERYVGLPADRADVQRWARELEADPARFPGMVADWLTGPAYAERLQRLRPKSDRQFLRGLFVDLTGALPDVETYDRCRAALAAVADGGPLRSVIARVLLNSEGSDLPSRDALPARELVRRVFGRFLGRAPSPDELETFATVFAQCECDTAVLVRALTTHLEYQYY